MNTNTNKNGIITIIKKKLHSNIIKAAININQRIFGQPQPGSNFADHKERSNDRYTKNNETFEGETSHINRLPYDKTSPSETILMWESELKYMAGVSAEWGNIEAGAEIYGFITLYAQAIIMLVTLPGLNAIHERAHFRQDIPFLKRINIFLRDNYGLFYLGNYHSHHNLGIKEPSAGDIESTAKIATKNGFKSMWQIIMTYRDESKLHTENLASSKDTRQNFKHPYKNTLNFSSYSSKQRNHKRLIEIHAFLYTEVSGWKPKRCKIEIIPGVSPFRKEITAKMHSQPIIPELCISYSFPLERIITQPTELDHPQQNINNKILPPLIHDEFQKLPVNIKKDTQIILKDRFVILNLPIPGQNSRIFIAYSDQSPYKKIAVSSRNPDNSIIDYTDEILASSSYFKLCEVYDVAQRTHLNRLKYQPACNRNNSTPGKGIRKEYKNECKNFTKAPSSRKSNYVKPVAPV
ncbi:MAG: hypothetical protein HF978_06395 [Desulfobacteraceae bacterium]|nr:hypothetical protein [Desulfobacteraceae bacterium]MBC2755160.1 hypothetical protein [Desulfobacteraceae bacterium]